MLLRKVFAVATIITCLLLTSTQELRATEAADTISAGKMHVVSSTELHAAVFASSAEVSAARQAVRNFLERPEVQSQIERMGFKPAVVLSGVSQLSNSEIVRLQSQVMSVDQQIKTAGISDNYKFLIFIGVVIGVVIIVLARIVLANN